MSARDDYPLDAVEVADLEGAEGVIYAMNLEQWATMCDEIDRHRRVTR